MKIRNIDIEVGNKYQDLRPVEKKISKNIKLKAPTEGIEPLHATLDDDVATTIQTSELNMKYRILFRYRYEYKI